MRTVSSIREQNHSGYRLMKSLLLLEMSRFIIYFHYCVSFHRSPYVTVTNIVSTNHTIHLLQIKVLFS